MTIQEIEERKAELMKKIDEAKTSEELEELRNQVEAIKNEVPDEEEKKDEPKEEPKEEEIDKRKLIRVGSDEIVPIGNIKEERNMEERKFTIKDEEYKRAWAKSLMGVELNEVEKRALGDALGTTATTYVASAADAQGVNNYGLAIPTAVVTALFERADQMSPIWRDIRKISVNGNVDVPYLSSADNAGWYAERVNTANEGQELKAIKLTGQELAKNVEITWKADQMTVEGFINFIVDELFEKMFKAKITAAIYGTGATYNQPTGLTNGLVAVTTGDTPIDTIKDTKATLSDDAKKGARVYISPKVADEIRYYKNSEGNYPFLLGLPSGMEEDPFLANYDIAIGNMRNYVWNEQEAMRLDRDINMKGRTVIYGAYQVCDGGPKENAFAYGQYTPSVSA